MSLDPAVVLSLAAQCAPSVAPPTLLALARAESALDPLAIGVNGPPVRRRTPADAAEAAAQARDLIAAGRNIDLGLGQINVRNLARLGLTVEAAFDPCRNLAGSGRVLQEGYRRAAVQAGPGQAALRVALSYYNTGHAQRGFANGYVARVVARAGRLPPTPVPSAAAPAVSAAAWDAFGRAAEARLEARFVLTPSGATP